MPHYIPELVVPGIGEIPAVVITDDVSNAEDYLNRHDATTTYTIYAVRLKNIAAAHGSRSKVAKCLLDYVVARMELEGNKCS